MKIFTSALAKPQAKASRLVDIIIITYELILEFVYFLMINVEIDVSNKICVHTDQI